MKKGLIKAGVYAGYEGDFLFRKDSNVFKDMIFRTLKKNYLDDEHIEKLTSYYCENKNIEKTETKKILTQIFKSDRIEDIISNKKKDQESKKNIEVLNALVEKIYDEIVIDDCKKIKKNEQSKFIKKFLEKDMEFAGCLERDFSTLMGLNKNDNFRYNRIFNYYWSSFFSIMDEIVKKDKELIEKYKLLTKNKQINYSNVFSNLKAIITEIYDEKFLKNYENNKKNNNNDNNKNKNYYKTFSSKDFDNYKLYSVITTNYTPFMELYFDRKENNKAKCDNKQDERKKSIYLSGKLSLFERSDENEVFDIRDENIDNTKLKPIDYFPFIMTQSPIKPIIHPKQIIEYNNFLNALESSEILVIIGYSLTKNDNHICCFLKEYYLKGKTIIYCKYKKQGPNSTRKQQINKEAEEAKCCDEAKEECLKNLNLDKYEDKNRFHVIINTGNADDLFENVNLKIKEIFSKEEKQAA